MLRNVGFVLGAIMLVNGVADTINPRLGFSIWRRQLSRYAPEPVNEMTREYERLSDNALRYVSLWQVVLALVLLFFAARVRD